MQILACSGCIHMCGAGRKAAVAGKSILSSRLGGFTIAGYTEIYVAATTSASYHYYSGVLPDCILVHLVCVGCLMLNSSRLQPQLA